MKKYNSKYQDGYSVRVTSDMIQEYNDLYDLDIYADILMIGNDLPRVALAYPVADCPVVFAEDTKNKSAVLKSLGLNMNFAPVVDITSDKNAYIYKRTFGQNSELTGKYAETVITASKNTGVSYSLKHFPVYGNNKDTHTSSSTDETSIEEFWNTHLIPFKVGIEAGAEAVMISHNIVSAVDKENISSLSPKVHDILRKDLKFTGIAITDDLDMDAAKNVPNKYRKALEAGNNIILCSEYKLAHTEILNAVKDGTITEDYLNQQVFKVLAWKYYKGLFE